MDKKDLSIDQKLADLIGYYSEKIMPGEPGNEGNYEPIILYHDKKIWDQYIPQNDDGEVKVPSFRIFTVQNTDDPEDLLFEAYNKSSVEFDPMNDLNHSMMVARELVNMGYPIAVEFDRIVGLNCPDPDNDPERYEAVYDVQVLNYDQLVTEVYNCVVYMYRMLIEPNEKNDITGNIQGSTDNRQG